MARLFGTNGIRWRPDRIKDTNFAIDLGLAIGNYFGRGGQVVIGMDTRITGPLIKAAAASGIMAAGCNIVDIGIVPTPTVQHAVRKLGADGGVVISASHNPPEFNGIKCIAGDGTELARTEEEKIEAFYNMKEAGAAPWDMVGAMTSNSEMAHSHIDHILSLFHPGPEWRKLRVVVDCSNGPAWALTPRILQTMGCDVLTINAQPDGLFPGRMPEPLEKNLGDLMSAVVQAGADFGVAHDGDADRAVFIDEKGNYVNGDASLAIFAEHVLAREPGKVVVPVNTSRVVLDTVEKAGGEVVQTAIGSPIIARKMGALAAVLGGEGNGGVIFPENMLCRDGMMTAAKMVEVLAASQKTLSGLISTLPEYSLKRSKFECPDELKGKVLAAVKEQVGDLGNIIELDGVKIENDEWWVLLRPSGTEPIFRVTAEAKDAELASQKLGEFQKLLESIIQNLS